MEEGIKKVSPKTQVLKVITDITDRVSVENLFTETFSKFNEIDVHLSFVKYLT